MDLIPCKPPLWAFSGHGQTLWGHFLKSPTLPNLGERIEVDLPDGDRLFCYQRLGKSNFVISLFHGLSGDVHSDYMQRTAILCERLGHTVILVNHRGAGDGFPVAKQPYHSGRAEDVSEVLKKLRELHPTKKHIAIGYSMSANIILCLLGGFRGSVLPDGAITVNGPINLRRGSDLLNKGLNRLYDMNFVTTLRKNIQDKHRHGLITERYNIPWWSTIWDFDQIYTAPAGGFKNRDDYYDQCSAVHYIKNIKTPTYVLTAADDPFVSVEDYRKTVFPESVQLHIEPRGGHLGYLSKDILPTGSMRWLDYYLHEAIKALENTLSK